jgi:hypothetical protein
MCPLRNSRHRLHLADLYQSSKCSCKHMCGTHAALCSCLRMHPVLYLLPAEILQFALIDP